MERSMIFRRYELKYRITREQKQAILEAIAPYMVIDQYGRSLIQNIYYDTPDFRLIRTSLTQPMYKEKIRMRSYGCASQQDPVYLELKKKFDGVVYKRRIRLTQEDAILGMAGLTPLPDSQIGRELSAACRFYRTLRPSVWLGYQREAYFCPNGSDFRITFDDDIRFRTDRLTLDAGSWGCPILPAGESILELKTIDSIPLWMARALSENCIFKTTFSKYGEAYKALQNETKGIHRYA